MNIFWIGLKIIEETKYELKKNIYILISKIYNNISNLTKYLRYIYYPIYSTRFFN